MRAHLASAGAAGTAAAPPGGRSGRRGGRRGGEEGAHSLRDFGGPVDAYFNYARQVVEEAGQRGMLVLLVPAYLGFSGGSQGWMVDMRASGAAELRAYGSYVGRKFAGLDNIVWVHGGDYDPPDRDLVQAIVARTGQVSAAFIKELMRRTAQFHLERSGDGALTLDDVDRALDEMLFAGGSLNLKLLGAEGRLQPDASG